MKITQSTLRRIIKEEITKAINEFNVLAMKDDDLWNEIGSWVEENPWAGTTAGTGLEAWLKMMGEEVPEERAQALRARAKAEPRRTGLG